MILKTKNNRAMKANTYTTTLITLVTFLITFNLNASVFNFIDEDYIDDIPFDTEKIYQEILNENNTSLYTFDEEAYVNDIPFSTEKITAEVNYHLAVANDFELNEESYIADIPFDTYQVVMDSKEESFGSLYLIAADNSILF
jgi:hypothetical protein